ncbi:MAG: subtilisin [Acidimicrobiales bacterium]|jgi:subtilisin
MAAVLSVLALVVGLTGHASAAPDRESASYIVVLEPGTADVPGVAASLSAAVDGKVGFIYEHALQGFSITASPQAAAALTRNPRVAYVERDQEITLAAQDVPTGIDRIYATGNTNIDIDSTDDLRVDIDVAVIDTGVDFEHPDLNVVDGVNCASGGPFGGACGPGGDDDHYHGTHVAGTIGALDNDSGVVGVAPGARIHAVKVLNSRGSGYTSWIVAGIDWVAARADIIEVANMSLGGGGYSQAEYDAIQGAVGSGVAFAVAAGNDSDDASNYSPAAFDNVLTVSALADFNGAPGGKAASTCRADEDDTLANFSNWGPAVDIAAPGVCILSTYPLERGGSGTISGTSMASPHAAGALALLASANNPNNAADVTALYNAVINSGNYGWTDESGDEIHEPLLDVHTFNPMFVAGGGGGPVDPANNPPTISITSPEDGVNYLEAGTVTLAADANDVDADDIVSVTWTVNGLSVQSTWTPTDDGAYTIVATADDSNGGTATDSASITVSAVVAPTFEGSAVNNGKTWTAIVTTTAATSGSWPPLGVETSSCVDGTCTFTLSGIPKKTASVVFTADQGAGSIEILKP